MQPTTQRAYVCMYYVKVFPYSIVVIWRSTSVNIKQIQAVPTNYVEPIYVVCTYVYLYKQLG